MNKTLQVIKDFIDDVQQTRLGWQVNATRRDYEHLCDSVDKVIGDEFSLQDLMLYIAAKTTKPKNLDEDPQYPTINFMSKE